jgi:hypothetical protein
VIRRLDGHSARFAYTGHSEKVTIKVCHSPTYSMRRLDLASKPKLAEVRGRKLTMTVVLQTCGYMPHIRMQSGNNKRFYGYRTLPSRDSKGPSSEMSRGEPTID